MGTKIKPSNAIIVRADTPIGDCVRRMRDRGAGSILVVSPDFRGELVGIFTERDLLKRIDLIEHGGHWKKPVSTVMSRQVKTISPDELDRAGWVMLKNNIRHLPIVADDQGKDRLVGVISMRDVFKQLMEAQNPEAASAMIEQSERSVQLGQKQAKLGVISRDRHLVRFIKDRFFSHPGIVVSRFILKAVLPPEGILDRALDLDALIFDIDHRSTQDWTRFLKLINQAKAPPFTIVLFNPTVHDEKVTALLEQLGKSDHFAVFEKPINVLALFQKLDLFLTEPFAQTD